MTAPFCTLCGNTNLAELGATISICLDAAECHKRQLRCAREAGARDEREQITALASRVGARFPADHPAGAMVSFADYLRVLEEERRPLPDGIGHGHD